MLSQFSFDGVDYNLFFLLNSINLNKALYFVLIETRYKKTIKLKIFLNNITKVKGHDLLMFIA